MCMIFHSDGHITIKVLKEQFAPILRHGRVDYVERFDCVLRNNGDEALEYLYLLSPQLAVAEDDSHLSVFGLLAPEDVPVRFAEANHDTQGADGGPLIHQLAFACESHQERLSFDVTRLKARLEQPEWYSDETKQAERSTLQSTGMTMAVIRFGEGQRIEPFDPAREAATTYWLRLIIKPRITHMVPNPIPLRAAGKMLFGLRVQPCMALGPDAVLDSFEEKLRVLGERAAFERGARALHEIIFDGVFRRHGTSTRMEDHRISLITNDAFLVLNPHFEGACGFMGVETVDAERPTIARTWYAGAKNYAMSDPLELARIVYEHLKHWGPTPVLAKTKEQISSALAPEHHRNVSHVVDALTKLGFLESARPGEYSIRPEPIPSGKLFLVAQTSRAEMQLGDITQDIRNALYCGVPLEGRPGEVSRFLSSSFRIHFDLLFQKELSNVPTTRK